MSSSASVTSAKTNTVHGSHDQYVVSGGNGSFEVHDKVSGRDGSRTASSDDVIVFSDGIGVLDPTGTAGDVDRLYSAAFGRSPDVSGLGFWTSAIDDSRLSLTEVASSLSRSPEFIDHYGGLSDSAFVRQLYQNVLNRPGDSSGTEFWEGVLHGGASRGAVLLNFAEGPENQAKTRSTAGDRHHAEAYRLYQAALDRAPDQDGQTFWASALRNGASPAQLAQGFIDSPEFHHKYGSLDASDFVSQLYQNVLHRAGDSDGQQYWTTQLQHGTSRADVLVGFSDSAENRSRTAGETHDGWVFIPS